MKYLDIKECDISNGEGLRVSLWLSGCEHKCRGCHNPQTWDKTKGREFTRYTYEKLIELLQQGAGRDLTITGGDPLAPYNYDEVLLLCRALKEDMPWVNIWVYTGYYYDELIDCGKHEIFDFINVLVDGRYEEDEKDENLEWRGSANQRVWCLND